MFDEEGRVRTFRLPRPVITIAPTTRYHYEDGDSDDTNDADTSTINSRAFSDLSVQPGAPRPGFLPFDYFWETPGILNVSNSIRMCIKLGYKTKSNYINWLLDYFRYKIFL